MLAVYLKMFLQLKLMLSNLKRRKWRFNNIVIEGYGSFSNNGTTYEGTGCKIQDATTNTNQVNGSKIKLTNVKITGSTTNYKGAGSVVVNFPSGQFTTSTTSTGASITNGAWSTVEGSSLLQ